MKIWIVKWVEYGEMTEYYPAVEIFTNVEEANIRYEELEANREAQLNGAGNIDLSEGILSEFHIEPLELIIK